MIRHLAIVLLLFATTTHAAAEPTPLADADVSLDDLHTGGERTFYLRAYMTTTTGTNDTQITRVVPKEAGTFSLTTKKTDDAIVFQTSMKLTIMGEMTVEQTMTCTPSTLMPPTAIEAKMSRGNRTQQATITISDGVAAATLPDGEKSKMEGFPPANSVTFQGLLSLLEILPREADQAWTVAAVGEMVQMTYVEPAGNQELILITCVGEETLKLADKELKCTRFELKTGAKNRDITAWVSDEGLQQLLFGTDMRMTAQPMEPITEDGQDALIDVILKAVEAAE
ncbi:MAG: hypothetical protein AAGB26_04035 [Planctomycetota bacterium]